jgi:hypothetical protein
VKNVIADGKKIARMHVASHKGDMLQLKNHHAD